MNGTNTYMLTIPTTQNRLFKSLAKEMGWVIEMPKKKKKTCGMDLAMDDIRNGRITNYKSVDDFFEKMEI